MKNVLLILMSFVFLASCKQTGQKADDHLLADPNLLHRNMKQLTEVIIHDVFGPPVASRIYSYTSLAAYEAIRFEQAGYPSLAAQLNGFAPMPSPEKGKQYNYLLAATKSFFTVAEKITFSKDTLLNYQNKVYADFKSLLDIDTYERSLDLGEAIGNKVLERAAKDNYKETRGMAKFLGNNQAGKWRPTPPDYLDGTEPYWSLIKPLALDSAAQFKCPPPPLYKVDTISDFYKMVKEVYTIGNNLTEEQRTIAHYWDDNPFVMEHSGHLMYANKKITPPGHWIGITAIACKKKQLNAIETAQAYVVTSIAMFDTFIACWEEKYRSQVVRPITVINELIDRNWQPMLQTPAFPEYTSGHSGISAAAATVLTKRFGDNFAFEDTSDLEYIGSKRNFQSFDQAAQEASISRVYGGIHYRTSVDAGARQGKTIAAFINNKLQLRE
ncbi:vanadium-dependent haloperoxidase [Chitinophagaceae bacterium LB-8]|uniref:Vanadium-dependent haloperoxidase n=1 Tax=Paraflavisolibacter caeni TaxID=2982496 RepID=A0A9X2XT42_9BACT|nr:vanadium-dependent haloperoxidase [Paraflavisolibacter caeni]MCU7547917.1 vanadium-dependent haloperoxidase [Paraflavisolibacter caeni]